MAKAGLTIAVSGTYNGRALEKARQDLQKMKTVAVSEMGGASGALVNFGSKAAELGGEIHNMGYKMEQVGSKATSGITVPIAAAAAACGAAAIDIDTSLTSVRKTVDGTEEQYQALKEAAIEFSKTNAVSASQILDIQALGAQLGFTIDELDEFSQVVSGLDIATDMDAETAATELAQFANITKMAHADVSNYGSAIVNLGNHMATTESSISSMSMRIAAASSQVNMSQAEILGWSAAMSSMGVEAEAGGTAFSTTVSTIDAAVATGSDDLQAFADIAGMSAEEFSQSWKNSASDTMVALLKGTDGAENMTVALESMGVTGIRQSDVLKRLAGNTDLVTQALGYANKGWSENTALSKEVENRNESMAAKLEILQNKVTAVAEKVGTPLVNALLDVVDAADPLIESVADVAQRFADMDEEDQKMILGLVGAAAAFGPVATVAGKLTQGMGNMVVGVGKAAQSLGVLGSDLGTVKDAFQLVRGGAGTAAEGLEMVKGSTTLVSGALGTLKTALSMVGIGAAVLLIGDIVSKLADWYEHDKMVETATLDLETAMGAASEAYGSYAQGTEVAADSLGEITAKTEEVISAQGELAKSMSDQWAEYGTNAAMVDAYAQEIQNLTNKYDDNGVKLSLTAEEQQRLKLAVDGFNDATGTSIEVTDALNGTLSESTDSILANAEAFKEQARAEAAIEMYKDLYKQQLQDSIALEEATNALAQSEEGFGIWLGDFPLIADEASVAHHELQQNVDDLTASVESNKNTQEQLLGVIAGTGQSFDSFDAALENSGIALTDFGDITDGQLAALQDGFDGTLSSIVATCGEQGIEIPQSLADAISANKEPVNEATAGLGADVNAGIQKGIDDTADQPKSAITTVVDGIVNWFKSLLGIASPSRVMAELGSQIDAGIKQGIEESQDQPVSAIGVLGELIQGAIDGLPDWMKNLGSSAGSLLSEGLNSLRGTVQGAGNNLFSSGKSGASPLSNALGSIGKQAGGLLRDGLNSLRGSVNSAGGNLSSSARSGANPAINALGSIGRSAASSLSSAIRNASAYGSGRSLANTAKSGAGSVSAYSTGQNFSYGLKNGMGSVNLWNAAYNIGCSALNAIKRALGIASPSKETMKVGEFFGEGAILGMKSTEQGIEAEAKRMSDAMTLNPSVGAGYDIAAKPYAASYQSQAAQGRSFAFDVTINVTASDERQAASIGRSIGDQLYLEFARRERAYA